MPEGVGVLDATRVAGTLGRLNAIDFSFDLTNRYNFWSGLIGGLFLALSYFGTDQSQVQRYLTGSSVTQSRLGLLFNGLVKVPMQFFILFLGAMVFAFYQFAAPPIFFNPEEISQVRQGAYAEQFAELEDDYREAFEAKLPRVHELIEAHDSGSPEAIASSRDALLQADAEMAGVRAEAIEVLRASDPDVDTSDTNYVFLTFIVNYLPAGLVGLLIAAILFASMSSTSSELNALASTSIVDIYRRFLNKKGSDGHYVKSSKLATFFWGLFAILFAQYASRLGSLIEAVNILGSLFYGTILGIFLLAFYAKWVGGTATFIGALLAEVGVVWCFFFTDISYLWYNVVGCVLAVGLAIMVQPLVGRPPRTA
jgi:Na+/proline symporter